MSILGIILLVIFCIVALLLIFLVAVQDENSVGLGGIFGGNSDSAFGSNTSRFITRTTITLVIVFMVLSLVVAIINKSSDEELLAAQNASVTESAPVNWVDQQTSADTALPAADAATEEAPQESAQ